MAAVQGEGQALEWADTALRADREVVLAAVRNCGYQGFTLSIASAELRSDRAVVVAAVSRCGQALQWAAPALRADREVVVVAVTQTEKAMAHAGPAVKADRTAVLAEAAAARAGGKLVRQHPASALSSYSAAGPGPAEEPDVAAFCLLPAALQVGVLQRLAFAACFTDLPGFAVDGGLASALQRLRLGHVEDTATAGCWHSLALEAASRPGSTLLAGMPAMAVIERAKAEGWCWEAARQ